MSKLLILATILAIALCTEQITHDNSAADSLVEYLDKMSAQITHEQLEHNSLKEQQDVQCNNEIQFRQSEVKDAQDAKSAAQVSFDRCTNAVTSTKDNMLQVDLNVRNINRILDNLKQRRDEEKAHYVDLVENQLRPALTDVQGAYAIIQELENEAISFVQLTRHVSKLFQHMISAKKTEQVAPLITSLLTLGSSDVGISREVTTRIRLLFNNLENDLLQAIDAATEVENGRNQLYLETVDQYNSVLAKQKEYWENLKGYLVIVEECVARESAVLSEANQKERRNQDALDSAAAMCLAFETEYDNAKQARQDEQDLLVKIKSFIKEQADAFGEYGVDEGSSAAFKKDFEASRNKQSSLIQEFISSRLDKAKQHGSFIQKSAPSKCKSCKRGVVQQKLGY